MSWIRPRTLVRIDRATFRLSRADHLICLDFRPAHHHVDDYWCA